MSGRIIDNPVLRAIIAVGAVLSALVLVGFVIVVLIPLLAAVITGVLLVLAVVLIILLVVVPLAVLSGVVFRPSIKGSGVKITESRELKPFSTLKVSGKVRAEIRCGEPQSVSVTTDDNLVQYLETRVRSGELSVRFTRSVSSKAGVLLAVSVPEFDGIGISGAADVTIADIRSDTLKIGVSGAAEIKASGEAGTLQLEISGAGKVHALELAAGTASVRISGTGNVELYAEDELSVNIAGAGRVTCAGQPEKVTKHISGAGRVTLV